MRTKRSAIVHTESDAGNHGYSYHVKFPPAIVTTGGRLGLGALWGEHHEYDLGFGFDAGYAFGPAQRYFGLFLRFGVAFWDLARRR